MDYSIRVPATDERTEILEKRAIGEKELPRIKDYVFKPKGVELKDFHPNRIIVRLREFIESEKPSTLVKLIITKATTGYTDKREKLGKGKTKTLLATATMLGFEKWGEWTTTSIEYDLGYAQVLSQKLDPIGTLLKIESATQQGLEKALELLKVKEDEKIEKNAAILLGEKLGLI